MKEGSGEKKTPQEPQKESKDSPVQGKQKALRFEEALNQAIGKIKQARLEFIRAMYQQSADKDKDPEKLKKTEEIIENVKIENLAVIYTLSNDETPHFYGAPIIFGKQEAGCTRLQMVHMLQDLLKFIELQDLGQLITQNIENAFVGTPQEPKKTNLATIIVNNTANATIYKLQEEAIKRKMGPGFIDLSNLKGGS
ncbi:MAG: hypothetical protein KKD44_26105 [Proteobacteria bacterium]|nr:hypothetical protein [Pseudomonadota bacterium]